MIEKVFFALVQAHLKLSHLVLFVFGLSMASDFTARPRETFSQLLETGERISTLTLNEILF